MRIIGLNGLKTSGKDTAYACIRDVTARYDLGDNVAFVVKRVGFADKLKIVAAKALGFDRSDAECIELMDSFKNRSSFSILYDDPHDNALREAEPEQDWSQLHDLNGRQYLQNLGSYARTVFGDTFWIDQVLPTKRQQYHDRDAGWYWKLELDTNEYAGVDILVITDVRYPNEADRVKALGGEVWEIQRPGLTSDGHVTEQPLPDELVDRVIVNDGTIANLESKIEEALAS